jgi:hypothetical protein
MVPCGGVPRPRQCAFSGNGGRFVRGNWACPTAERLKDFANGPTMSDEWGPRWIGLAWSDDHSCGVLGRDGAFLVLVWYKSRNRLDACVLIDGRQDTDPMPKLAEVLPFLENAGAQYR